METSDNAASNNLTHRYRTFELSVFDNLLVISRPCFSHMVNNAVKHILEIQLPFGSEKTPPCRNGEIYGLRP